MSNQKKLKELLTYYFRRLHEVDEQLGIKTKEVDEKVIDGYADQLSELIDYENEDDVMLLFDSLAAFDWVYQSISYIRVKKGKLKPKTRELNKNEKMWIRDIEKLNVS